MFLVGGGILVHGVPVAGHALEAFTAPMGWVGVLLSNLGNAVAGLAAGLVALGAVRLFLRLRSATKSG
jgi:predicted DNA repair protein MutK